MSHRFLEYQPYKGDIEKRTNGSIIAMEGGTLMHMLSINFRIAVDSLFYHRKKYMQVR
jgi:predicted membrane GTPase involved in stress response